MDMRLDRVTKLPGLIASGQTYTMILKGDKLYMIRTGKYIDFDGNMQARARGLEGMIANKIAEGMIAKMYGGRLTEIVEFEKKITDTSMEELSKGEKSYLITKAEIEEVDYDPETFRMKLKTKQGKFKFYFSTQVDPQKVDAFVAALK